MALHKENNFSSSRQEEKKQTLRWMNPGSVIFGHLKRLVLIPDSGAGDVAEIQAPA